MKSNYPKAIGITLARGGSKGIPGKNLVNLYGRPLIDYTLSVGKACACLSEYIVSTDDLDIQKYVLNSNVKAPFLRPAHLATDEASSADALRHAVLHMEEANDTRYEYVVELMITNPFKTSNDVESALLLAHELDSDSVIGVSQVEEYHPARLKKIVNGYLVDFHVPETSGRRQDLKPDAFIRNGSIYVIKRDLLVEHGYRYGGSNSRPFFLEASSSVNIDSPLDLVLAEHLLTR